jgi:hypothetical protein
MTRTEYDKMKEQIEADYRANLAALARVFRIGGFNDAVPTSSIPIQTERIAPSANGSVSLIHGGKVQNMIRNILAAEPNPLTRKEILDKARDYDKKASKSSVDAAVTVLTKRGELVSSILPVSRGIFGGLKGYQINEKAKTLPHGTSRRPGKERTGMMNAVRAAVEAIRAEGVAKFTNTDVKEKIVEAGFQNFKYSSMNVAISVLKKEKTILHLKRGRAHEPGEYGFPKQPTSTKHR